MRDAWRGFANNVRQGVPGHNWLLMATLMSALGLGGTHQSGNVMNWENGAGVWAPKNAVFGPGDRAGLAYLYQPRSCPA
jgi:hypothetical protein